jgi:branched-chain amino acid transport system substrate-binding protein
MEQTENSARADSTMGTPGNLKRRKVLQLIGGGASATSLAGCLDLGGSDDGQGELQWGMLGALSGALQYIGEAFDESAEIWFNKVNNSDEILPDTEMSYSIKDTETSPETARSKAEEFVIDENVDVLMGPVSSASASAVANFAFNQNVPLFAYPSDRGITAGSDCRWTSLHLNPHTGQMGDVATDWCVNNLGERFMTVWPNYTYGEVVDQFSKLRADALGAEQVESVPVAPGETEWGPIIEQIRSANIDYVHVEHTGAGLPAFLSQAAQRELDVPIASLGLIDRQVGALSEDAIESLPDLYYTGNRYYHGVDNQRNNEFVEEYTQSVGEVPTLLAGLFYLNIEWFTQVLDSSPSFDTADIVETAEGFTGETVWGEIDMRACDHQGSPSMWVSRVEGLNPDGFGEYELIEQIDTESGLEPCEETECDMEPL